MTITTVDQYHYLIFCESCGKVSEFERCPLDLPTLKGMDFEIGSHTLEIYGRCTGCK